MSDWFGAGSALSLTMLAVSVVANVLVELPTCPSNCTAGETTSPVSAKLVTFFKLVAVFALPVMLPLIVPTISSACIDLA